MTYSPTFRNEGTLPIMSRASASGWVTEMLEYESVDQLPRRRPAVVMFAPPSTSTPEIRADCGEDRKVQVVQAAAAYFAGKYETITIDGVRWRTPEGWGLIRASNTQPILVMRFEARTAEGVARIRDEALRVLADAGVHIATT